MKERLLAKRAEYQMEYSDLVKDLEYLKVKLDVVNEMIADLEEDEEDDEDDSSVVAPLY